MRLPMKQHAAMQRQGGRAARRYRAFHSFGRENHFRVLISFEDLALHLAIPRVVAGLAARRIHDELTRSRAGTWIEFDFATLKMKRAVDSVGGRAEGKVHDAACRIKRKGLLLRGR